MTKYVGFLFSKLHSIGSRSEGPEYFLQQKNYAEVPVVKGTTLLWKPDPELQKLLGSIVSIQGKMVEGRIQYEHVEQGPPHL